MDLMLINVDLNACGADRKKTLVAFAKVSDELFGVVGALLGLF
jgi:hypothetical protein